MTRSRHVLRALCASALCWLALPARAEPALRVRALSHIETSVVLTSDAVHVSGTLRDDQGAPIAPGQVHLRMEPETQGVERSSQVVTTSPAGEFDATFARPDARSRLQASYEGDVLYERCETTQAIDLARAAVRLRVELATGRTVHLDADATRVEVQASSTGSVAGLRVVLQDELGRRLGSGVTDQDGLWKHDLSSQLFGSPGAGVLVAWSDADATHQSARAELAVLRVLQTELTLKASLRDAPTSLLISGSLRDARGPLDHKAVGIFVDEEHVLTLLTDARGAFQQELVARRGDQSIVRSHNVQARFQPDAPWLGASRSKPVALPAQQMSMPSALWLVLPALLSITLVLRASGNARIARDQAALPRVDAAAVAYAPRARLTSAARHSIAGVIVDAETLQPLPGARLGIHDARQRSVMAIVCPDGAFSSEELPAGRYQVSAGGEHYATVSSEVRVPHGGDASALQIPLSSLRALAMLAYRPIALRLVRDPRLLRTWTVRDVLAGAQRGTPAPAALVVLTSLVEAAGYGQTAPTAAQLETIRTVARATLAMLDDRHAPVEPGPER